MKLSLLKKKSSNKRSDKKVISKNTTSIHSAPNDDYDDHDDAGFVTTKKCIRFVGLADAGSSSSSARNNGEKKKNKNKLWRQQKQRSRLERSTRSCTTSNSSSRFDVSSRRSSITTSSSSSRNNNDNSNDSIEMLRTATGSAAFDFLKPRRSSSSSLLCKIEPTKRRANNDYLADIPIAQLKTTTESLYGRQEEINTLKQCFQNMIFIPGEEKEEDEQQQKQKRRQLVLISGYSGTGKSALAATVKECVATATKTTTTTSFGVATGGGGKGEKGHRPYNQNGGIYAKGKFDYQHRNKPYAGISMACRDICGTILHQMENSETLRQDIVRKLGTELSMLTQVIPALEEIASTVFQQEHDNDDDDNNKNSFQSTGANSSNGLTSAELKNRMTYAFRRFFRVISEHFDSFVLVIDDLQWADVASLGLLDKLLSDQELNHIMLIAIFRSNEIDTAHPFQLVLDNWKSNAQSYNYTFTEIGIGNLQLPAVTSVIQDMLRSEDDPSTLELAKLCFRKTHGNVFFLKLLMSALYEQKLLEYNLGTLKWMWDAKKIEKRIPASDNIIDLLKINMTNLPPQQLEILKLAACLGSSFKLSFLEKILLHQLSLVLEDGNEKAKNNAGVRTFFDGIVTTTTTTAALVDILSESVEQLVDEGYFKQVSIDFFQFSHDKIQEASLLMIPQQEKEFYFFRVGMTLLKTLSLAELDVAIFVVVDLLNQGSTATDTDTTSSSDGRPVSTTDQEEKAPSENDDLKLAILNCHACRKAFEISAFEAATEYASIGYRLLPRDEKWSTHYRLSLDLCSTTARAESALGRVEKMEYYCNEVLAQQDKPLKDKFSVYHTLIDSIGNRGKNPEAVTLGLNLLSKFNCRFPKTKTGVTLSTLCGIASVKSSVKSWTSERIDKLGYMDDTVRNELSRIMDKLLMSMYMVDDARMPLVVFRNLKWTRKYGINTYSPSALTTTGVILCGALEDFRGGAVLGRAALQLLDRLDSRFLVESRVIFVVNSLVLHWSTPLKDTVDPFMYAYQAGLKCGDLESAGWSILCFIFVRALLGTPLRRVEKDIRTYMVQIKDLERIQIYWNMQLNRQFWLNLMGTGTNGNPLVLDGDEISSDEVEETRKKDTFFNKEATRCEVLLHSYFGAHEAIAAKLVETHGAEYEMIGSFNLLHYTMAIGVSSFAAYRKTKNKKYLDMGIHMKTRMRSWVVKGNPNVVHLAAFLDAEFEASKGKLSAAIKHFELAVLLSARGGLSLDAAFASERFAELFLEHDDEENFFYRLSQALKYYKEADANGKVHDLEQKYADLLQKLQVNKKSSFFV